MLGPHTVTVVRPGSKPSAYGNTTTDDWSTATRTPVPGCSVQPMPSSEYTVDRDNTATLFQAWLPISADVLSTDRLEWAGQSFDVEGAVQRWDFPPLAHQVATLRRSEDDAAV